MATVGTKLTIPFIVGAGQIVGQGRSPEAWVLYTTDDASNTSPVWNDATAKLRNFSTSRGRESELQEFDAGSATLTLDNRTRTFDPNSNAAIRPLNRWWIREQFSGETNDIFKGYAESYDNQWPGGGFDAECVVSCADEFKVLALDALPVTDPPRDTYGDIVEFDDPSGWWRLNDPTGSLTAEATIGGMQLSSWSGGLQSGAVAGSPLIGDMDLHMTIFAGNLITKAVDAVQGDPGDAAGLAAFAVEFWYLPVSIEAKTIAGGPLPASGTRQFLIGLNAGGTLTLTVHTTVSTYTATTGASLVAGAWHHIVLVLDSNLASIYINGVSAASVATAGTVVTGYLAGGANGIELTNGGGTTSIGVDELAFYRHGLSAARVLAHYQAGTQRGFEQQASGARVGAVLDASTSDAPRSLQAGVFAVLRRYMNGAAPLDKIREAVQAEATDAAFFTTAGGTLTFLASNHRGSSPYNTVQVTVGDAGGAEIPYLDVNVDYSESFLLNDWNVTRDGGLVQHTSDTTSIGKYFKRSQSLTGLALTSDADAATVAAAMLAKYKDPMQRVTNVSFDTTDTSVAEAVFRRELMDKITVKRTPPGGGSRISQDLFIQKIEVTGNNDGHPWSIKWGVSPL